MLLKKRRSTGRKGVSAVEFAVILPLLAFLFVIGLDFARVFYFQLTLTNAARAGAMWGSNDVVRANDTDGIKAEVLAETTDLSPQPTVETKVGTNVYGDDYLAVTVTWTFKTVTHFPGVTNDIVLSRTVKMRISPKTPAGDF